ncbi:sir2p [Saccharomyces arboricola H-6]|uniref:Sir2p n=1 Tax=Saccharomyces arboricola (strain H-6 / AS 2.3317 / CBS 10644) TaxID=1160507 RepID=J8Q3Y8_SACAR|nr:sir2p [Saccharomyces arboricola H-6]
MTIPHMNHAVSKNTKNKVSNAVGSTQDQNVIWTGPDAVIGNDEPLHKKPKMSQLNSLTETNAADKHVHTQVALGQVAAMELRPSNDTGPVAASAASIASLSNDVLRPEVPQGPIMIGKNESNGIFYGPSFTKRQSLNARMFLKYYGAHKFLDTYLPEEVNSLYIYYLIKLLGFEVKDQALIGTIKTMVQIASPEHLQDFENITSVTNMEDPLAKKQTVRLIKDLQRAINKVLCTRLRLSNFFTIDHFIQKLHTAKNVLVLTGAGVSTSLGIPDFRSSEGFYSKIRHLGLDDPQDVFNYNIFMHDPSVFYNIANMVLPPENLYSPLHSFIKMLQTKGKLLRNYTQNIDNLESYAGISTDKLVQCHGSFATATCVTCHWNLPGERIFNKIRNLELPLCPYCYKKRRGYFPDGYGSTSNANKVDGVALQDSAPTRPPYILNSYGVLKPDITFFGEALPNKFHKSIREDILKCDLLICIGTSLKVAPVSEIVNMVPAHVPQVLINRDPVKHAEFDLSLLGYCDDIAAMVAQKCDWAIPHKKWNELKNKKFECQEKDRGVYVITSDEHPRTL